MKPAIMMLGAACLWAPGVLAQPDTEAAGVRFTAPTPHAERNAAIAYQRAWLQAPDGALDQIPSEETLEASRKISHGGTYIDQLLDATRIEACDFEVPTEEGIDAALPHLTPIRRTSQLLIADARSLFEYGDSAGIAERLAAVIRLADHTTNDRFFVTSMMAGRLLVEVEPVVIELVETDAMSDEDRAVLLTALARFDREDTFRLREAIVRTVEVGIANSIPTLLAGERERAGGFDTFASGGREPTISEKRRAELLAETRPWITDTLDAWDADDAIERLRGIGQAAQQGRYGVLGQKGLVSLVRVRAEQDQWTAALGSMRSALADDSE